ncbi:helix-turn-helix transcriptional regulator [Nocardioides sp. LML1-1-1.1]|uniref:helix-turn-helix transcriptional regulator n=1 Tax=Nocardioides sp. LML1-1-1.1 TaxID=3135248 RepID=UPI003420E567
MFVASLGRSDVQAAEGASRAIGIRPSAVPLLWATERSDVVRGGRGLVQPGAFEVACRERDEAQVLVGMAASTLWVPRIGGRVEVPPRSVWVASSPQPLTMIAEEYADLRVASVRADLLPPVTTWSAPVVLDNRTGVVVRAGLELVTPDWIDAGSVLVGDLSAHDFRRLVRLADPPGPPPLNHHDRAAAFLLQVRWALRTSSAAEATTSRRDQAERHIADHLGEPSLDTDSIATALGMSRRSLQKLFEDAGGVAAYIRRRRLESAVALLSSPHRPGVDEVARRSGFSNRRALERAMRKVVEQTPAELRRRAQ